MVVKKKDAGILIEIDAIQGAIGLWRGQIPKKKKRASRLSVSCTVVKLIS